MILSHKKKFIFIHIYKVAGLSIRQVLYKYDDQVFKDFPVLDNIKFFIGRHSQLFTHLSSTHIKASELKSKLDKNVFNNYFKFSFVRNPWDWQVSLYHFMLQYPRHKQHLIVKKMKSFKINNTPNSSLSSRRGAGVR